MSFLPTLAVIMRGHRTVIEQSENGQSILWPFSHTGPLGYEGFFYYYRQVIIIKNSIKYIKNADRLLVYKKRRGTKSRSANRDAVCSFFLILKIEFFNWSKFYGARLVKTIKEVIFFKNFHINALIYVCMFLRLYDCFDVHIYFHSDLYFKFNYELQYILH